MYTIAHALVSSVMKHESSGMKSKVTGVKLLMSGPFATHDQPTTSVAVSHTRQQQFWCTSSSHTSMLGCSCGHQRPTLSLVRTGWWWLTARRYELHLVLVFPLCCVDATRARLMQHEHACDAAYCGGSCTTLATHNREWCDGSARRHVCESPDVCDNSPSTHHSFMPLDFRCTHAGSTNCTVPVDTRWFLFLVHDDTASITGHWVGQACSRGENPFLDGLRSLAVQTVSGGSRLVPCLRLSFHLC